MRRLNHFFIACSMVVLTACQHAPVAPAQNTTAQIAPLALRLSPASFNRSISLTQQITVEYSGSTHQLDGLIEINPQQINVVLMKFGQRAVTISDDGQNLNVTKNPHVPEQIKPEQILSSIQLAFWPTASIAAQLPEGYRLVESSNHRALWLNDALISSIEYNQPELDGQTAIFTNTQINYRMTIVSRAVQ
jgi:hypothetical protein